MIPAWHAPPPPRRPGHPEGAGTSAAAGGGGGEEEPDDSPVDGMLIRPFLLTGGRTRPLCDGLRVETLVTAPPSAMSAPLRFELRNIVECCQTPVSIAEISARLQIPLGVTKVLVADLVSSGMITCTQPAELSIEMIERIRDRVRSL